jgi:hypothetical protein
MHNIEYIIGGKNQNDLLFAQWFSASNVFPKEKTINIRESVLLKCTNW